MADVVSEDHVVEITKNLDYLDTINFCQSSPINRGICSSESFWRRWVEHRYPSIVGIHVTSIPYSLLAKELYKDTMYKQQLALIASVEHKDIQKYYPKYFHYAPSKGHMDLVKVYLSLPNRGMKDWKISYIHDAVMKQQKDILILILYTNYKPVITGNTLYGYLTRTKVIDWSFFMWLLSPENEKYYADNFYVTYAHISIINSMHHVGIVAWAYLFDIAIELALTHQKYDIVEELIKDYRVDPNTVKDTLTKIRADTARPNI